LEQFTGIHAYQNGFVSELTTKVLQGKQVVGGWNLGGAKILKKRQYYNDKISGK